ncbi:hypothetical protein TIFTF001_004185 [Ficus carica]|uniref:F-box domain-containing protein n=1 Tax=Ficus carica TaxID=3494 RepID=A0AA87ZID8_FICCA|nr:hypothetical protein TIFTF001_004185 [Ficus carica]
MSTNTTTTEAPSEILIPSLPNDIALQCLARVPRRYHPVLSTVSKPIRSLLSSPEFFAARSALYCTEHLLLVGIRSRDFQPAHWFTLYRRPHPNSAPIMVRVRGIPSNRNDWSAYVAVGPKIYVLGGQSCGINSAKVWIFDCRFHTWEPGPNMPTARKHGVRTVVLDDKIYVIGWFTEEDSWVYVFETVASRWESLPCPKLTVYHQMVAGCGIRGGKVCVWVEGEELRFDPVTKTWEVFRLMMPWVKHVCEVNGVLYCSGIDVRGLKGFDEGAGYWKRLKLVNGGLPNDLLVDSMANVGGRLVIMGRDDFGCSEWEGRIGVWFAEIEVKKMEFLEFQGEVVWSDRIYSCGASLRDRENLYFNCLKVSL